MVNPVRMHFDPMATPAAGDPSTAPGHPWRAGVPKGRAGAEIAAELSLSTGVLRDVEALPASEGKVSEESFFTPDSG